MTDLPQEPEVVPESPRGAQETNIKQEGTQAAGDNRAPSLEPIDISLISVLGDVLCESHSHEHCAQTPNEDQTEKALDGVRYRLTASVETQTCICLILERDPSVQALVANLKNPKKRPRKSIVAKVWTKIWQWMVKIFTFIFVAIVIILLLPATDSAAKPAPPKPKGNWLMQWLRGEK